MRLDIFTDAIPIPDLQVEAARDPPVKCKAQNLKLSKASSSSICLSGRTSGRSMKIYGYYLNNANIQIWNDNFRTKTLHYENHKDNEFLLSF